ncbi:hypothetical protein KQX54_004233 [Cotesia glomerata]|uniref:Uncharacterized protein n=1 Tax=Cotesia glomerata TaxID=32391 RepID=A0AAV7I990_COTGL|nr:hypothetical protein KQX54_004233 [Cotesia glomerata]
MKLRACEKGERVREDSNKGQGAAMQIGKIIIDCRRLEAELMDWWMRRASTWTTPISQAYLKKKPSPSHPLSLPLPALHPLPRKLSNGVRHPISLKGNYIVCSPRVCSFQAPEIRSIQYLTCPLSFQALNIHRLNFSPAPAILF